MKAIDFKSLPQNSNDPILGLLPQEMRIGAKKKPAVAFTIADKQNEWMVKYLENSLRKFHSKEDLPLIVYRQDVLDSIPDPTKLYKATPLFGRELIEEYKLVLKLDCDQIVTGSLDFILTMKDYDVGTVLNINRVDPKMYGVVSVFDIPPNEYYNCGLVAMRSHEFIEHWWRLCNTYHFNNLQYREQDLLNILCHYGNYRVRCFDQYDVPYNYYAWHGLVSKGEWNKVMLKDGKLILPKGKDNYPDHEVEIKVLHWAGGKNERKLNYKVYFNEDVIKHLDYLTNNETNTA